jgi:hypothetical protein
MRETVRNLIENDATLQSILTGGVWDADELDRRGLSIRGTAKTSDNLTIKPIGVLRWGADTVFGPHFNGERRFLDVYVYQPKGYTTIDSAMQRIKNLLHRQEVAGDDVSFCWLNWVSGTQEFIAEELGGAAARMIKFEVIYLRR